MSNHMQLNNVDHKDIRVITERSSAFGDDIWYSLIVPKEYKAAQHYYPIFFQKDGNTGKFMTVALSGFQHGENLYLDDSGWSCPYIPLSIQRMPFLIGKQQVINEGREQVMPMVHIDMSSPRISRDDGEPLFKEFGGHTEYLEKVTKMLEILHRGIGEMNQFINALLELNLIEPVSISIKLENGSQNELVGFYTINETKLNEMDDNSIISFHRLGYMQAIYYILGSHIQVNTLIEMKNKRLMKYS